MQLSTLIAAAGLVATAVARPPFKLRTQLKPGQTGKEAFDGLWLFAYHTGAGTNDAVMSSNSSHASTMSLNPINVTAVDNGALYTLDVGLNTPDIPWGVWPATTEFYAAWQPVQINAGTRSNEYNAFYTTEEGLQWTTSRKQANIDTFAGWLVCEWWHPDADDRSQSAKQLFYRLNGYGKPDLATCADVNLVQDWS